VVEVACIDVATAGSEGRRGRWPLAVLSMVVLVVVAVGDVLLLLVSWL
jgi:hypothetical protein